MDGSCDNTLFIKRISNDIMIAQIYVNDTMFGSTSNNMRNEFVTTMQKKLEMSMLCELNYFLSLRVKLTINGAFLYQTKYTNNLVKCFGL